MSDLLTSLDIVNQAFKKTMRGYDPAEVDEFLDRVAECIQIYTQKTKDYERALAEQADKLRDYENLKGSLQEALLMAQKTAEERIRNATATADNIVTEAKIKAERIVKDAEGGVIEFGNELNTLQELRNSSFSSFRVFIEEIANVLDRADTGNKLQLPDFTRNLIKRSEMARVGVISDSINSTSETEIKIGPKKMDLSDTLNALGLDPNLLLSSSERN